MTLAYGRFAFRIGFDRQGNWVTTSIGTRVYVPLGFLYEPTEHDFMIGVSLLFVLAAVLVTRNGANCVNKLVVLLDRRAK